MSKGNVATTGSGSRSGPNLQVLYEPRSIAVVGASPREGKRGRTVIDNLISAGYQGGILAVNPNYEEVLGLRCYPSVASLPVTPDMAAICLPSSAAVAALEECGRAGIPGAAIVAGGFAESGAEGAALQDRMREVARTYGLTVAGPN